MQVADEGQVAFVAGLFRRDVDVLLHGELGAGRMDPLGRRGTLKGFAAAVFSLLLSLIGLAFWATIGLLLLREMYQD